MFRSYHDMPKEAIYLICATILPSVAYGMFYMNVSYFLVTIQHVTYELMGLVVTTMGISTFVASILLGVAADRYGRRKILLAGNVLASLMLAVFALTTNPVSLLVAAAVEGIAEGAVTASTNALLAEKANISQRNSVFSLYGFAQGIAFGLGGFSISATVFFEHLGLTTKESHVLLYLVMAMLSLVSTLIVLKVGEAKSLGKPRTGIIGYFPRKSKAVLSKYVLTGALLAFGAGMIVPLMTVWFRLQYGVSDTLSSPILGISSILIGVTTLFSPPLARRLGLVKTIVVTQAASTVFMLATPISPNFTTACVVYSVRALLMNMASPLEQSMIMGLVAQDERGAASGIAGALWRLPNALSTFIGAWLMGIGFLAAPFFMASLFYVISILLFSHYFGRTRVPE